MRRLGLFGLMALMAGTLVAQSVVYSGSSRGFMTSVGPRMMVQDKSGNQYALYRDQMVPSSTEWRLGIAQSTDGGQTWNLTWQTGFDPNPTGEYGNIPCSMTIDSQENLHVVWCHEKVNYRDASILYNRFDKTTQTWGTEVTLVGAGYGRTAAAVAVDSKDYVWVCHSHTSSWQCTMSRSDVPYAADMKFSATTPAFPAQTCQHPSLVIDAKDRVHLSFYSTANGATVHHLWMDPNAATPAWSAAQPLGNNNSQADYYSSMAADGQGHVYIVYGVDGQAGKTADPFWEIRKWDSATQTWSSPIQFYKTTRAQFKPGGSDNDGRVVCAACDETTGEFYFTYRDFDTGKFLLARWHDGDVAPTIYAELATTGTLPVNSRNYMLYPNFRGAVFPAFNQTSQGLDLIYCLGDQTATTPVYTFTFDHFPVGSLSSTGTPKIGTTFPLDLSAPTDGGKNYVLAMSMAGINPGLPIDRRFIPLVPDVILFMSVNNLVPAIFQDFSGALNASGAAQAKLNIPNLAALVSLPMYGAFVTVPGGPAGVSAISNPFTFTITN